MPGTKTTSMTSQSSSMVISSKHTKPKVNSWRYDEYLELSNLLHLYRDPSHKHILNMVTEIQGIVEEIHDYCIVHVHEYFDRNNKPILAFSKNDIDYISSKMGQVDCALYVTLGKIYKKNKKDGHIVRIINQIKEISRNYTLTYFTTVAYEEWNERLQDLILYNKTHIERQIKEKNLLESSTKKPLIRKQLKSHAEDDRNNTSKKEINVFEFLDFTKWGNWIDIGEPLQV